MTIYGADISILLPREREQIATNLEFNLADMEEAMKNLCGNDGLLRKIGIQNDYLRYMKNHMNTVVKSVKYVIEELRIEEGM